MKRILLLLVLVVFGYLVQAQAPGCPAVDAGPNQDITCANVCVDLVATPFLSGETTEYDVQPITYAPPFGFNGGTPLFVGNDDVFSATLGLPFPFCFYGNTYNSVVVGANGVLTFDLSWASQGNAWEFSVPGITPGPPPAGLYNNSIHGAFHDMDPRVSGSSINYAVLGAAPCRSFVLNFSNVGHFDCNNLKTTQQIVLYETTNAIEVYIANKPTCNSWNGGNAFIGIQNATGTQGVIPPGRNTGNWSASNEAWQFGPTGPSSARVHWYDSMNNFLGTTMVLRVCPTVNSTYTAQAVYDNCFTGDTVAVTDQVSVTINGPATVSGSNTNETCDNGCNGTITINASGGFNNGPFTYNLGNGAQASNVFTGLCDGTYSVTTTDAGGCTDIASYTVLPGILVSVSDATTDEICSGDNNGTATLTATGGTAAYTYNIGFGAPNTTGNFSGLPPNTYNYSVTDAAGCVVNGSFTITAGPICCNVTTSLSSSDETCDGGCDGEINITLTNGVPPFSFNIGNGPVASGLFQNLCDGNYTVTMTDGVGCMEIRNFTIDPGSLVAASSTIVNETCTGAVDGSATITGSGGITPYTFDIGGGFPTNQSGVFTSLPANVYNYTVTDNDGCFTTGTFTINSGITIAVAESFTNEICSGANDGTITLVGSGGTGPYNYNIGFGLTNTTGTFTGLADNTYNYTVTDANGCNATGTIVVAAGFALSVSSQSTNEVCAGNSDGTITFTANNGLAPHTFNIGVGPTNNTGLFTGLAPNRYNYTVTDANGCSATGSIVIANGIVLSAIPTATDEACFGNNDGTVSIAVSNGTAPFTYNIGNGVATNQTGVFNGLSPNIYNYTITDALGCSVAGTFTVFPGDAVSVNQSNTGETCAGTSDGTATLVASGGVAPYTYDIGNGVATNQTGAFTGLVGNAYSYTVTDANGCAATGNFTIITGPTVLAVEAFTNETCAGDANGTITLTASAGTAPYTFDIGNGVPTNQTGVFTALAPNTYNYTISDNVASCVATGTIVIAAGQAVTVAESIVNESCLGNNNGVATLTASGGSAPYTFNIGNGVPTNQTGIFTGLAPNNYNYTVTDVNGCFATGSFAILAGPALNVNVNVTDETCSGESDGAVQLSANGGITPYTYNIGVTPNNTSGTFSGLAANTYNYTITDNGGCTLTGSFIVASGINMVVTEVITQVSCPGGNDGAIDITVTGGTTTLYNWSNNAITQDLNNLASGNYDLLVTDLAGCTFTNTYIISEPVAIDIQAIVQDVSCNGFNDGLINVTTTGGTGVFTYAWSNNAVAEDLNGLGPNTYIVVVTDQNNCTASASFVVTEPALLVVDYSANDATCGLDNGSIFTNTYGGTQPYGYEWQNQSTNQDQVGIASGTYSVTVTDDNNCTYTIIEVIEDTPPMVIDAGLNDTINYGDTTTLAASFDNPGVVASMYWTPSTDLDCGNCANPNASPLVTTTYVLTVEDSNGCVYYDEVLVVVDETHVIYVPNAFTPNGDGRNDYFTAYGENILNIELKVFDRWGELMFLSTDRSYGWDGTQDGIEKNPAVFVYSLKVEFIDGRVEYYKGSVALLR